LFFNVPIHVYTIYNIYMYYMFCVLVVIMTCVKALGYTAPFIIISGFWHTCIRFDNLYQLNTCLLYIYISPSDFQYWKRIWNHFLSIYNRGDNRTGWNNLGGRRSVQFVSFKLHELISYFALCIIYSYLIESVSNITV